MVLDTSATWYGSMGLMPWSVAVLVLALLVGVPGGVVLADRAKPGDALFAVDRSLEDFRLRFATSPEAKASLKVAFARERADELGKIDTTDEERISLAVDELAAAVAEADAAVDEIKIRVKVRGDLRLSVEQLRQLLANLFTALQEAGVVLAKVKIDIRDDRVKVKVRELDHRLAEEMDDREDEVELRGVLRAVGDALQISAEGKTFTVESTIDLAPFVAQQVKVEGSLVGTTIEVRELELGRIKVTVEDNEVRARVEGTVQKVDDKFQVTESRLTFTLVGALATPDLLDRVVGKTAEIRGTLDETSLTLGRLKVEGDERILIERKEVAAEEEEDEVSAEVKTEVKIRTETDREEAKIENQEIELRGILNKSGIHFVITVGGTTYTIQGSGLDSMVDRQVRIKGTLSGNTVTAQEVKLDSSGSGGNGSDEREED